MLGAGSATYSQCAMEEQFRTLGRERQADLDREARRFALADEVRRADRAPGHARPWVGRAASTIWAARAQARLLLRYQRT